MCRPGRSNGAPTELRNMTVDGGRSGRRVASDEHSTKNGYVIDITGYCRSIIYRGLVILLLQRLCQLSPPIILSAQTRLDHLQTPRNLRGRIFSCARSLMRTNQETSYIVTGFPASPHQIPCSGSEDLGDIANLGLTLAEGKLLLAGIQKEIVAAQARDHAVWRPDCLRCGGDCRVKDYRDRAVATLFGQVTVRLPRFRCAECGAIEVGGGWPSHCRSTPELDQLRAQLSALMPYRTAAAILEQMFPVSGGKDKETLRRHTLKAGAAIRDRAAVRPETAASAITITLDSTFIRSCEDGQRHLEVRVGNVETASGGRQVRADPPGSRAGHQPVLEHCDRR